jgi:hypothetical protein
MAELRFDVKVEGFNNIKDTITEWGTKAEHALAIQVAKDTTPYVPFKTGTLSNATKIIGNMIVYPGPYSRFLYYGKLMVDPDTGSPWARKGAKKVLTDRNLVFSQEGHSEAQAFWFEASKAQNLDKWVEQAAKEFG